MVGIERMGVAFDEKVFNEFCQKYAFAFPASFQEYMRSYNDAELKSNVIFKHQQEYYVRYFYGTTDDDFSNIETIYLQYKNRFTDLENEHMITR